MSKVRAFKNFINGEWASCRSGRIFENRNPADQDDIVGLFQDSSEEDIRDAVEAAVAAYTKWRLYPAPRRAEILFRAGQMLIQRKEEFARDMTREMGKVLNETRGDVQEAIDMTFFIAGEGRRMHGHTVPSELPNKFAMSVRMPLGVCGLITPWNFPMAIPSWKMIPALVCGNTVVIKPAEDTPLSAVNFCQVLEQAGMPKGVVNLVSGFGPSAGAPLVRHCETAMISFTGSTSVGQSVAAMCAPHNKPHHLEMGGKNIIIVLDDANIDLAVEGAIWGGFGTTGQRCTAASRVAVHKKVYKEFIKKFVDRAKKLRVGNGLDEKVEMGPVINASQLKTIQEYVSIGKEEGAKLLLGGSVLQKGGFKAGFFHEPTIFADADPKMRIAREEIFGPVVTVLAVSSLEEAIEVGNSVEYGLSSSIYTQNVNNAFIAMRDMFTGIFYVNSSTIGAEVHLPFGGTKATGNGHREAGHTALDVFSEWKSIYVDFSGKLQKAQIDPFED
ncbi:MAG TPA: aldehyde dehydrogenase family protein [Acidobacteriota bacterium]|jgi:aldehyde dehydrogenase (NAD+)|nr:aldehyde dehydrogenase family protein [Acidobacteriota bacterium]